MDASTTAPESTSSIVQPHNSVHLTFLFVSTVVLWATAVFDWILRDSVPYVSALFYASPPVVIGTIAFLLTWWIWWNRNEIRPRRFFRRMASATAILGVICLAQWGMKSFRTNASSEHPAGAIKVVFWNTGYNRFASLASIGDQARSYQADVLALSETSSINESVRIFWRKNMPGYSTYPLKSGMTLLVNGKATEKGGGRLGDRGEYRRLSVEVRNTTFDIIIGDLESDPLRSREEPLRALFALMQGQSNIPTLVVGDFNTPPSSVWFDAWRTDWKRAWDVAGSGYEATWPQPLPVLALDHVWGNQPIVFHHCRNGWTRCSDHRPVIVELSVNHGRGQRLTEATSPPKIRSND